MVVSVGNSLEYNKRINNICRKARALFVASNLYGNIGYIFDDFLGNFTVTDADGEVGKEVSFL